MTCKICNNSNNNKTYIVREMMLGLRDEFTYFQCANCECLQIAKIPSNISLYYPSDYYSFSIPSKRGFTKSIRRIFANIRNNYLVFNKGILGRLIAKFQPKESFQMLSLLALTKEKSILDIGCGSGSLLYSLKEIGFSKLLGADPFIAKDIQYSNGLKIAKKPIHELNGKWDVIMFHHSFEHMENPLEILQSVSRLLNKDGICLIRVPTVSSYAWKHYRENWVSLDAPRHFFLHSKKSINYLLSNLDMKVIDIVYDSNELQFWGSEQYIRNIPLSATRSSPLFKHKELLTYRKKANKLNLEHQGDTCAFFLKKK